MTANTHTITLGKLQIANNLPFTLIAGPCQIESLDHTLYMAEAIKKITDQLGINLIFKSSFDKANRTAATSPRGIGLEKSLEIFAKVRAEFECPIITDIHTSEQCAIMAEIVDILQVPAFLCRQTDLLKAAAETKRVINVKKGQFLAPWDMKNVHNKLKQFGAKDVILTERGACFGYNTLVSDMRGLAIMAEDTGAPVFFDATHSVQQPSGQGSASGGERKFVSLLARSAIAAGVAGVFMEVHQDPDNAPSDGPCMLELSKLAEVLHTLRELDRVVKSY